MQAGEDELRRQKREEQAKKEQVVEEAVQEMRFVCDVCGNKSYKNVVDYTNHLDSYATPQITLSFGIKFWRQQL